MPRNLFALIVIKLDLDVQLRVLVVLVVLLVRLGAVRVALVPHMKSIGFIGIKTSCYIAFVLLVEFPKIASVTASVIDGILTICSTQNNRLILINAQFFSRRE